MSNILCMKHPLYALSLAIPMTVNNYRNLVNGRGNEQTAEKTKTWFSHGVLTPQADRGWRCLVFIKVD